MKKYILSVLMFISFSTMIMPKKAHALLGVVTVQREIMIAGAISSGVGCSVLSGTAIYAAANASTLTALGSLTLSTSSFTIIASAAPTIGIVTIGAVVAPIYAAIGLIILEDDTHNAQLAFQKISKESNDYKKFEEDEINTYNNQIDELNAIVSTIRQETTDESTAEQIQGLWVDYSSYLDAATIKIAQDKATRLVKSVEKNLK